MIHNTYVRKLDGICVIFLYLDDLAKQYRVNAYNYLTFVTLKSVKSPSLEA